MKVVCTLTGTENVRGCTIVEDGIWRKIKRTVVLADGTYVDETFSLREYKEDLSSATYALVETVDVTAEMEASYRRDMIYALGGKP